MIYFITYYLAWIILAFTALLLVNYGLMLVGEPRAVWLMCDVLRFCDGGVS